MIRSAEALRRASSVIKSSISPSETGGQLAHHEHVGVAYVLLDLDLEVLVGEPHRGRLPQRDAEVGADGAGQGGVRQTGEDFELSHCRAGNIAHLCKLGGGRSFSAPVMSLAPR